MSEKTATPKIKDFGITSAFVVIYDNDTVDVIAIKPGEEQIVELAKQWQAKLQKQGEEEGEL